MKCPFGKNIYGFVLLAMIGITLIDVEVAVGQTSSIDFRISKKAQSLLGKSTSVKGPNCWNLALVATGLLPSIRHTDSPEFRFYIESNVCRMLKNFEQRKAGDIGAIRLVSPGGFVEYHGFVFLGQNQVLSKNGTRTSDLYQIQSLDEVLSTYKVPSAQECRLNELNLSTDCVYQLSVFRCERSLQNSPVIELVDWIKPIKQTLDLVDRELERALIGRRVVKDPLSLKVKSLFLHSMENLNHQLDEIKSKTDKLTKEELKSLRWVQVTLASQSEQLGSFKEGELSALAANTESRVWDYLDDQGFK